MEAYQRALNPETAPRVENGVSKVKPGTINDLVVRYYRSAEFISLKVSTQSTYRSIIDPWRERHGDKRVATLHRQGIEDALPQKAATPTGANNWLKRMLLLMAFAIDAAMRADNPTIDIKPLRITSPGHPAGEDRDDGRDPSAARAAGRLDRLPADQLTFLMTDYGKAFTSAGFGNWFRDRAEETGLSTSYNTHGLRKAGATRGAEAGWTDHEDHGLVRVDEPVRGAALHPRGEPPEASSRRRPRVRLASLCQVGGCCAGLR